MLFVEVLLQLNADNATRLLNIKTDFMGCQLSSLASETCERQSRAVEYRAF